MPTHTNLSRHRLWYASVFILLLGSVGVARDHVTAFMRPVVRCVRDCLSLLPDVSLATAANPDSDLTSNQP